MVRRGVRRQLLFVRDDLRSFWRRLWENAPTDPQLTSKWSEEEKTRRVKKNG